MPGLLSSPVCLTVIWFLSWSLRPSRAQIQTDEGNTRMHAQQRERHIFFYKDILKAHTHTHTHTHTHLEMHNLLRIRHGLLWNYFGHS